MGKRKLSALILAGGRSRRMGSDKATLRIGAQTQLDRTAALLADFAADVFVSVRADQTREPARAGHRQLVDKIEDIGPLGGIHAALTESDDDWLIVACDLPMLDAATLSVLTAAHSSEHAVSAFAGYGNGLPEPLCAIWTRAALPWVEAAIAAERYCPRKILLEAGIDLLPAPASNTLDNANTPEDLQRMQEAQP